MLRRLVPLTLLLAATSASGDEVWQSPALDQGLTGGLHTVYATTGQGKIDLYGSAGFSRESDLFGDGTGAQTIPFRFGAVLPVLDFLEVGLDIAGSSVSGIDLPDETTSFGDVRLRAKYAREVHGFGLALFAGYDLLQGVENISRVADVATPRIGLAASMGLGDRLRTHANLSYIYDRTVNMLNGTRSPTSLERVAWQMRDYTYLLGAIGVELLHETVLPIVEYAIEQPVGDVTGGRTPIHTISGGLKYRPIEHLILQASLDVGAGGNDTAAPAVPLLTGQVGLAWRFGESFATRAPVELDDATPAESTPAAESDADQMNSTPPSEDGTDETASEPAAPESPTTEAPAQAEQAPTTDDAPKEPAPATQEPSQSTSPSGDAVDLNQFAD
ncbi:MAG: hypothetical protein D6761_03425 [Candidatus Dadabacteria bacterium]|nr:MAG: hypothetical protein D6761_03425 [Candidatus Dadabacteria bacterium]